MGGLFGGDSGGGSGTSTTTSSPWSGVQPYLKKLFSEGETAKTTLANSTLPSQLSAGLTPEQQQAQQMQLQTASKIGSAQNFDAQALQRGMTASDLNNNPYFKQAVDAAINPVIQNFNRTVLPAQTMNAMVNSGLGSSRQGIAEGIARSDLNQQLLNTTATMADRAYTQGQNTELAALRQAPTTYASWMQPATAVSQVGAQNQAVEQQKLDDAMTAWNFERSKSMDALQQWANLLGYGSGGTSTSTTSGGGGGSKLGNAIGGAMTGYAMTGNPWMAGAGALAGLF